MLNKEKDSSPPPFSTRNINVEYKIGWTKHQGWINMMSKKESSAVALANFITAVAETCVSN